jgi:hypothetical protein
MFGLTGDVGDDDVGGSGGAGLMPGVRPFDEVSFRAADIYEICVGSIPSLCCATT